MSIEIRVPALGKSMTEATVGKWFRQPGETVKVDEPLVELETDKVTVEVPAPASGVLGDILVESGATVAVGSLLAALKEGAAKKRRRRAKSESIEGRFPATASRARDRPSGYVGVREIMQRLRPRPHARPSQKRDSNLPKSKAPAGAGRSSRRMSPVQCRRAKANSLAADTRSLEHGRAIECRRSSRIADADNDAGRPTSLARQRCDARGAREDDEAAPDHRATAQGSAEHRRHADDVQRRRHERRHGAAHASTRSCSRSATA